MACCRWVFSRVKWCIARGWTRAAARRARQRFEGSGNSGLRACEVKDDVKGALAKLKPEVALYVGRYGHRDKNFRKESMVTLWLC